MDLIKKDPSLETLWFSWAQGFMSGMNIARLNDVEGAFDKIPMEEQKARLRTFCEANPSRKYSDGVLELYSIVYPRQK
jgi:hypothetical protein